MKIAGGTIRKNLNDLLQDIEDLRGF
jgi:hypothetical protein